jgi:perosamine synthetase
VITNDDDGIAGAVRLLRNQGQRSQYDYERPGLNFSYDRTSGRSWCRPDVAAPRDSGGSPRWWRLAAPTRGHSAQAWPRSRADDSDGPSRTPSRIPPVHRSVDRRCCLTRDELLRHLKSRGIECGVYYPRPVFDYGCFRRDPRVGRSVMPRADRIARCWRYPSFRSSAKQTSRASWKPYVTP